LEESALSSCRRFGCAVVVASAMLAPAAQVEALADEGGGLVGWVESTHGAPVAGAVVSVFGKGIRGGNLLTLSDSQGQFVLPSLPAGSYTLRAIGIGHVPSPARHITVLPNRDSLFTVSLTPVGEKATTATTTTDPDEENDSTREWRWLMRHKRRSILETAGHEATTGTETPAATLTTPTAPAYAWLGPLAGRVELMAASGPGIPVAAAGSNALPGGLGAVRLQGQLAEGVRWSLGGLVAESEGRAWRTAAEFVIEPGGGHEIQAGAGYGAADARTLLPGEGGPTPERTVGAAFVRDRWRMGERVTTTVGARYTYLGFLPDSHHADAVVQVELRGDAKTLVRGSVATRTLAPGGDLLTLSTVAASPGLMWARLEDGLRAARTLRSEFGVERSFHAGHLDAYLFQEDTHDLLATTFEDAGRNLRVGNAGQAVARGLGLRVGRQFGSVVNGSVSYTFGHGSHRGWPVSGPEGSVIGFNEAEFHDLVARLETFIPWSDTRVAALCRLNAMSDAETPGRGSTRGTMTNTRFDVQVTQGLPFLQPLTRADWELLLAVRNMFYEASEGGFLDELAVQDPPTRVVGGISVRF
jgi:hypothetical protein